MAVIGADVCSPQEFMVQISENWTKCRGFGSNCTRSLEVAPSMFSKHGCWSCTYIFWRFNRLPRTKDTHRLWIGKLSLSLNQKFQRVDWKHPSVRSTKGTATDTHTSQPLTNLWYPMSLQLNTDCILHPDLRGGYVLRWSRRSTARHQTSCDGLVDKTAHFSSKRRQVVWLLESS